MNAVPPTKSQITNSTNALALPSARPPESMRLADPHAHGVGQAQRGDSEADDAEPDHLVGHVLHHQGEHLVEGGDVDAGGDGEDAEVQDPVHALRVRPSATGHRGRCRGLRLGRVALWTSWSCPYLASSWNTVRVASTWTAVRRDGALMRTDAGGRSVWPSRRATRAAPQWVAGDGVVADRVTRRQVVIGQAQDGRLVRDVGVAHP